MKEVQFSKDEVLAYLEDMIQMDYATQDETDLFEDIQWNGTYSKTTYNKVIRNMKKLYNETF